jgi:hypothetical protein
VEERPNVNDPVVLRSPGGGHYPSRVENLGEGLVVVVQPVALPDEEAFANGTELGVSWADSDDAVIVLPTRILAIHGEAERRLWSLVVTGPAVMEQRRRVERVDATGPIVLRSPGDNPAVAVTGSLVDISEKSVRCSVETGSADAFLSDRNAVVAEFSLGSTTFVVPGRVEFARATKHPTELEELVVLFDEPVADVDALRKQLFAEAVRTPPTPDSDADHVPG